MNARGEGDGERGAVAVAGLLLTMALVLLIGTGIDIAHAFILRRDLTAIADDAALAGSQQLNLDAWRRGDLALDPIQAEQAADSTLAANPRVTATAAATTSQVTVDTRESFPTLILRYVGIPNMTVTATATATPQTP